MRKRVRVGRPPKKERNDEIIKQVDAGEKTFKEIGLFFGIKESAVSRIYTRHKVVDKST